MTDSFVEDIADNARDRHQYLDPYSDQVSAFITTEDEDVEIDSMERFLPAPRRARGVTTVWDMASFLAMVGDFDDSVTIFADDQARRLTAIYNYFGWQDHRLVLQVKHSPEWKLWAGKNGTLMKQAAFATHLEEGMNAITQPSAMDLIEIAQSFQASTKREFEAGVRQSNGDVTFSYVEETTAQAKKGTVEVPDVFQLKLPVFTGGGFVEPQARLRYRIEKDGLYLGYGIPRLEEYALVAFKHVMTEIEQAVENTHRVVFGPAPEAIDEL